MFVRGVLALGAAAAMAAAPAYAQERGTIEVGGYGALKAFDKSLSGSREDIIYGYGGGARVAYYVWRGLAIEGDAANYFASQSFTGGKDQATQLALRLTYNYGLMDRWAAIFGMGYVRNLYRSPGDAGGEAIAGLRYQYNPMWAVRVAGTIDYQPSPTPAAGNTDETDHYGLLLGLDYTWPRGRSMRADTTVVTTVAPVPSPTMPTDSDNDGVTDVNDRCPNTPPGDAVDASGCSLPKDSDRDGVMDQNDRCPNTPAGDAVDANGCSLPKDADNDGVTDDKDLCPNTPAGSAVDANGCVRVFAENTTSLTLKGVNFASGTSRLTAASRPILDSMATLLTQTNVRVEVAGHTDNLGTRAKNLKLSQARADTVMAYLASKGVSTDRMTAKGYGPDQPIASNKTAVGRAQNRRVELRRVE